MGFAWSKSCIAASILTVVGAQSHTASAGAASPTRPAQIPNKERVAEIEITSELDPEREQPTWRRIARGREGVRPCMRFADEGGTTEPPAFDVSGGGTAEAGVAQLFLRAPRVRRIHAEWLTMGDKERATAVGVSSSSSPGTPAASAVQAAASTLPAYLERIEAWADAWGGVREIARTRIPLEEMARGPDTIRVYGRPTDDGWDVYVPSGDASARVSDDRIEDGVFTCGHAHVHIAVAPVGGGSSARISFATVIAQARPDPLKERRMLATGGVIHRVVQHERANPRLASRAGSSGHGAPPDGPDRTEDATDETESSSTLPREIVQVVVHASSTRTNRDTAPRLSVALSVVPASELQARSESGLARFATPLE